MEFAALSDLWEPRVTRDEVLQYAESNSERADYLYELGVCISHLHLQNILPDSSESNFIRGRDGVKLIDYGGIRMDAHTDADYAKNLLPFLLGFTRPEWEIFKRGYLSESYAHSGQVIEYIEAGEARPWIRSIAEGRYEDAALQLRTHLDSSSGMEVDEEVGLRSELALSLTMSGDHAGAVEVYREALRLGAEGGVAEERLAIICFNLGWAAFRLRDLETAEENFLRALGVYEEAEFQPRVALQALSCLCEIAIVQGARAKQKAYAARLEKARKRTRARGESPELILSGPVVRE